MNQGTKVSRNCHSLMTNRWILALVFHVWSCVNPAFAIERELFGVRLGSQYETTKAELTSKYGKPYISQVRGEETINAFVFDKNLEALLVIGARKPNAEYVSWVEVSGPKRIPGLKFPGNLNLGD